MSSCSKVGHKVNFIFYEAEDTYLGISIKNISYDKITNKIFRTDPDIVAFSCVTDNFKYQLSCAKSLKKKYKDIFTIFGGIHPTALPEKTLQNNCIDAVAIGEAEFSLVRFLAECGDKKPLVFPDHPIPGIMFKKNNQIIGNCIEGKLHDLDKLPFPDKEPFFDSLLDSMHEYRIITSRGCPYQCSYCFNDYMYKLRKRKIVRRRSVSNVIEELLYAKNKYSIKYIIFVDDSFTTDKNWVRHFCIRYRKEINLPFACVTNPQHIDEEISKILANAGCINIQLGIQSLSETLCNQILREVEKNNHPK